MLPLLGSAAGAVSVSVDAGAAVWAKGAFVPGAPGVIGASATAEGIAVEHLSGTYAFTRTG